MKLLWGVGGAAVLIHAFFFLAYGSIDPCKAAATRLIQQEQSDFGRGVGMLLSGPIESVVRSQGAATCYRIAIFGDSENPN